MRFSDVGARHQVRAEIDLTSALTSRPSDHTEALFPLFRGETAPEPNRRKVSIRRSSTDFKKSLRNTKEMFILSVGRLTRRAPQRRLCSRESRPSKQAKRRQAARLRSAVQVVGVLNFHLLREGGTTTPALYINYQLTRKNSLDRQKPRNGVL